MAIAFDSATLGQVTGTTLTFAHTCSGSNRLLLVFATANTGQTISGVTYNSISMTQQGSPITDASGPKTYAFYLIAPATGSNNVVVTSTGSSTIGTASSYTGVKQSAFPDAYTTQASATTTSYSATVTTVADNSWVVASSRTGSGFAFTGSGGSAVRQQPETTMLGAGGVWDSGSAVTPAGSKTVTVTSTSQFYGGAHVISLEAFTGQTFSITETTNLTETVSALRTRLFSTLETLTLSETVSALKGVSFTVAENIGLIEIITMTRTRVFAVVETLGLVEVMARIKLLWTNQDKNTTTWTEQTKNSTNWTNQNKS